MADVKKLIKYAGKPYSGCKNFALDKAIQKNLPAMIEILAPYEALMLRDDKEACRAVYPYLLGAAAADGDRAGVRKWLWLARNNDGKKTALMIAASHKHVECFNALRDIEIGLTTADGKTALHFAAISGVTRFIPGLLEVEGGRFDEAGKTAAMYAAAAGNSDALSMLAVPQELCKQTRDTGKSALMFAASRGDVPCVRILLNAEACLRDKEDKTALHHAIESGHEEVIALLAPHEGSMATREGTSPLELAVNAGLMRGAVSLLPFDLVNQLNNPEVVKLVESDIPELVDAVHAKDIAAIEKFFAEGGVYKAHLVAAAVANSRSKLREVMHLAGSIPPNCESALMAAAVTNSTETLLRLVEHESGYRRPSDGMTALMMAIRARCYDTVSLLLEPEVGITDDGGRTALHHAVISGDADMVQLLVEDREGVSEIRMLDDTGRAPMHLATLANNVEIVKLLCDDSHGVLNSLGQTCLEIALLADHPNEEMIETLFYAEAADACGSPVVQAEIERRAPEAFPYAKRGMTREVAHALKELRAN